MCKKHANNETRVTNKCMKRCPTSLRIKEMHDKATSRSHYHCPKFKTSNNTKWWRGCGYTGLFHTATTLENRLILMTTLNIHVLHNIAFPHPDTYPQETLAFCPRKHATKSSLLHCEEGGHPETTQMCSSLREWRNALWEIHPVAY